MRSSPVARTAALGAAAGFAGLAVLQVLLAAGVPIGEAAWGGTHDGRLPAGLRVGSALSIIAYAVAAALVLARAGFRVRGVSRTAAHVGAWAVTALLALASVANLASSSPWERYLLGPVSLVLTGACLLVARSTEEGAGQAGGPGALPAAR